MFPAADAAVLEITWEALQNGDAHLEQRNGTMYYVDPLFGPDVPFENLGYDAVLGLLDTREAQ